MKYPVFVHVQRPSKLFGMHLEEAGVLLALITAFMFIGIFISLFTQVPIWYYPFVLLLVIVLTIVFRRTSNKNYPNYLLSYISYYFQQAWVVEPSCISFQELKPLSYYQEIKKNKSYDKEQ